MHIWPAIDIFGGKCVRLSQGDYDRETVYGTDPADMAARWVSEGADCLHIVNLDGARSGHDEKSQINFSAIQEIAKQFDIPLQIGGGLRSEETIRQYFDLGIRRFVIGTKAFKDPDWTRAMIERFPEQIVIGIDAKQGFAATDGWEQVTDISALGFAREMSQLPIAGIIYTDISKDGMLSGPNFEAMKEMSLAVDVPVIASGGVTTEEDVARLTKDGLSGCIIGKALYEGRLSLAASLKAAQPEVTAKE